jgi:hypothetical protein
MEEAALFSSGGLIIIRARSQNVPPTGLYGDFLLPIHIYEMVCYIIKVTRCVGGFYTALYQPCTGGSESHQDFSHWKGKMIHGNLNYSICYREAEY